MLTLWSSQEGEGDASSSRKRKLEVRDKPLEVQKVVENDMYVSASYEDFRFIRAVAVCLVGKIDLGMEAAHEREWEQEKEELKRMYAEHEAASAEDLANAQAEAMHAQNEVRNLTQLHSEQTQALCKKIEDQEGMLALQRKECDAHRVEVKELKQQVEEEHICVICKDKPRDTFVMPCSHFQYCLACLLEHRNRNGNTCPTCRRLIEGLCMSSNSSFGSNKVEK